MRQELSSWAAGGARQAIEDFVERVTTPGTPDFVEPAARIAVHDNDGTLWCEKPVQVEVGFVLQRLAAMAAADATLQARQPWKAAHEQDHAWFADVVAKHYAGDDSGVKVLVGGILAAFEGMDVEDYQVAAAAFLAQATHPKLKRRLAQLGYLPMVELLRYLEAYGFTNYIASGGDRDFMRTVTQQIYGIPAERVIGSTNGLRYIDEGACGRVAYLAKPDVFDDGAAKPVRIWSRIGQRPLLAFGNSNGDIQMLRYAGGPGRPALRLLLLHDDAQREFDYTSGAEQALEAADKEGWTVVSIRKDWTRVFAPA